MNPNLSAFLPTPAAILRGVLILVMIAATIGGTSVANRARLPQAGTKPVSTATSIVTPTKQAAEVRARYGKLPLPFEVNQELSVDNALFVMWPTVLEIFGYSALFCIPVLVPIAAKSRHNEEALKMDPNQTYEAFDNLAMGNVEVSTTDHFGLHRSKQQP